MRNQSNNFLMDGATNNDTFNTGFVLRPPPDAIEEFKILTHAFSAEYGRNAGSVVNVVTKSGSQYRSPARCGSSTATTRCRRATTSRRRPSRNPSSSRTSSAARSAGRCCAIACSGSAFTRAIATTAASRRTSWCCRRRSGTATSPAARRSAIRSPASRFPATSIPAGRISAPAAQLLRDFVPLPNSAGNRYIVSPTVNDVRDQFGARVRLSPRPAADDPRPLHAQRHRAHHAARSSRRSISARIATLQDGMVSHNFVISSTVINQARFSINRISAESRGDQRPRPAPVRDQFRQHQSRSPPGCRRSPSPDSSAAATPPSAMRSSPSSIASITCGRSPTT